MVKQNIYLETAMRELCPNEIIDRRDKVGFETPMGDWVANLASKVAWLG